ncbi:MAG: hypothetical protein AAGH65_00665 [Pseudomonadota bacterium]
MTLLFYLLSAVAIAMALAFSLKPLLGSSGRTRELKRRIRRIEQVGPDLSPDDWQQRRDDLLVELAQARAEQPQLGRGLMVLQLVLIPLATIGLYGLIGTPESIDPEPTISLDFRQALGELTQRVQREPRDIEAWMQIGAIQKQLQQYSAAEGAWRRVLFFEPDEPIALTELAETLLFASGERSLGTESRALLNQALAIEPGNQKALFLLGIDAFQRGEYERALTRWRRLETLLPPGEALNQIQQQIARAEQAASQSAVGLDALHAGLNIENSQHRDLERDPESSAQTEAAGPSIAVSIDLSAERIAALTGNEVLFVFARALDGPPAPLAVQRLAVQTDPAAWPVRLVLTNADSMAPGLNLSTVDEVEIVARISASGNAIAQSGDLESISTPVATDEGARVAIRIERSVP